MDSQRPDWRRARRAGERAQRRAAIVAGARNLLVDGAVIGDLSARDLAKAADLSPAGLYTYFTGREAILLAVATEELVAWLEDVAERLGEERSGVERAVFCVVGSLEERPLVRALLTALPALLENAPDDAESAKLELGKAVGELGRRFEIAIPGVDGERAVRILRALVVGLSSFATGDPTGPNEVELSWFHGELAAALAATLVGLAGGD